MSTEPKDFSLAEEDTTVENKQSKPSWEASDPSSSSSSSAESSSSEENDGPTDVPLAQSFPSSESSEEEQETAKDNKKGNKKKAVAGLGLFLRGFETAKSKARKRRRFGSLQQQPDEPLPARKVNLQYRLAAVPPRHARGTFASDSADRSMTD